MRIVAAERWTESIPLTRPYTIAYTHFDAVKILIVTLRTEGGHVGWGAGVPIEAVTGESLEAAENRLSERIDRVIGEDIRHLNVHGRRLAECMAGLPAARCAIDIALHDLYAQLLGVPLADALGRAHDALPTSITIGIKPTDEAIVEANEYVGRGFRILKVKTGQDVAEDIERVHRIREAVGPEVGIRVDANQGYTRQDAEQFLDAIEPCAIEFLEQPFPAADLDSLRALPAPFRARIAADESLFDARDGLRLLQPEPACGVFNIKLMKCGGPGEALRIATVAEAAGIDLMWGCMDESRISIAAALHTALACPATRYLDLDGSFDLASDVVEGGFVLEDGMLRTTDAPGLGVRPLD